MNNRNYRTILISLIFGLILFSLFNFNNIESNEYPNIKPKTSGVNEWTERVQETQLRGIDFNANGSMVGASSFYGCWISYNYGRDWIEVIPSGQFREIGFSDNGQYVLAPRYGGKIYVSNDYGNSFTQYGSNLQHYSCEISSNGSIMFVPINNAPIRRSDDYGQTWASVDSNNLWWDIAGSKDCKYVSATIRGVGTGVIKVSSDYGLTFTTKVSGHDFRNIDVSGSGQYQLATARNGKIFQSTDYGNTWNQYSNTSLWRCVAISNNGSYAIAHKENGYIYESFNYGVNWSLEYDNALDWWGIAMSDNATLLGASERDDYVWIKDTRPDTTPPTWNNLIEITDPLLLGNNETIKIDVYDFWSIDNVSIEINNVNYSMTYESGNTYNYTWQPNATGIIPYIIYMYDEYGNLNFTSDSITVYISYRYDLQGSFPIMTFIVMIFLFCLMLFCYVKFRIFLIILTIFLFSIIFGVVGMSESILPFTPFFQIFFILFQSTIFIITSIELYNKIKRDKI